MIGRKPTHLLSEEDRKKMPKITDLWVDLGAASADEVKRAVRIGDPVTVELGVRELPNRRLSGPKLDNTAGLFVVLEALKRLSGKTFDAALFVVSAVQEEIGLRGATTAAHGVDPEVGIGVDVTHATDCPTIDRREHGTVDLGKGPVLFRGPNINPVLHDQLCELARSRSLPYQVKGAPRGTPNDANVLQLTRVGSGDRGDRHPQPLHAHAGRDRLARRRRHRRRAGGGAGRDHRRRRELHSLSSARRSGIASRARRR